MKDYAESYFDRKKIIKKCEGIEGIGEQIKYLKEIKHQYITEPPVLDVNLLIPNDMGLVEYLDIQIEYREGKIETSMDNNTNNAGIVKIKGRYGNTDITRIFEAMFDAGLISGKTEIPQVSRIFFAEPMERKVFELAYNARKSDTVDANRNSNSSELLMFVKKLIEKSFSKKNNALEEIIKHIEELQKNSIY